MRKLFKMFIIVMLSSIVALPLSAQTSGVSPEDDFDTYYEESGMPSYGEVIRAKNPALPIALNYLLVGAGIGSFVQGDVKGGCAILGLTATEVVLTSSIAIANLIVMGSKSINGELSTSQQFFVDNANMISMSICGGIAVAQLILCSVLPRKYADKFNRENGLVLENLPQNLPQIAFNGCGIKMNF